MSRYLRCDFAEWKIKSNSLRSPFIVVVVISKFFANIFTATNFKDRPPTVDGKNSAKCRANVLAEQ